MCLAISLRRRRHNMGTSLYLLLLAIAAATCLQRSDWTAYIWDSGRGRMPSAPGLCCVA